MRGSKFGKFIGHVAAIWPGSGPATRISSVLCELSSGLHTADLKLSIRIHSAGKTWRVSVHFVTAS